MSSVLSVCERHNIVVFDMFVYSSLIVYGVQTDFYVKYTLRFKILGSVRIVMFFLKKFRMLIEAIYLIKNTDFFFFVKYSCN